MSNQDHNRVQSLMARWSAARRGIQSRIRATEVVVGSEPERAVFVTWLEGLPYGLAAQLRIDRRNARTSVLKTSAASTLLI